MARPDFRSQAAERLATERTEHTPVLIDLLSPDEPGAVTEVHRIDIERISANPSQPRRSFDPGALQDLAASIREHGILQPVLVRPRADGHFQLIAGERRWRAARLAGLRQIPAIVEPFDDEAALEISIIENLQREDISPLEEAELFERMTTVHGYSLRKLAQKLGKDKGYIENRLRLADAPPEVRELVSVRSDTLSAAYELMKVSDPRKRRRLAQQVATGELSLSKLRQRIAAPAEGLAVAAESGVAAAESGVAAADNGLAAALEPRSDEAALSTDTSAGEGTSAEGGAADTSSEATAVGGLTAEPETRAIPVEPEPAVITVVAEGPAVDDAPMPDQADAAGVVDIDLAARQLAHAIDELVTALLEGPALSEASSADRQLFTKYLTINKIKLENAIAVVRVGAGREAAGVRERR